MEVCIIIDSAIYIKETFLYIMCRYVEKVENLLYLCLFWLHKKFLVLVSRSDPVKKILIIDKGAMLLVRFMDIHYASWYKQTKKLC